MNIEKLILSGDLVKYLDLYKHINLDGTELLCKVREVMGSDVLVNYEIMLKNDYVETKKQMVTYIGSKLNEVIEQVNIDNLLDKKVFDDYIKDNFVLTNINPVELELYLTTIGDTNKLEMISHFASNTFTRIKYSLATLQNLDNNTFLSLDINSVIEKYNTLLDIIDVYLTEHGYIPEIATYNTQNVDTCVDGDSLEIVDIRGLLLSCEGTLIEKIKVLKESIKNININKKVGTAISKEFNSVINDYKLGIMTEEDYTYKTKNLVDIIKYYVGTFNNYISLVTNYVEVLECYVLSFNTLQDDVNTINVLLKK